MASRGGGRARGRAKLPPQAAPQPTPAAPLPHESSSGRASHRGAGRPQDDTPLVQRMGRMQMEESGNGNGSGNGAPVGRGNMRGKRQIYVDTLRTRPETLVSKKGTTGQPIKLQANYFSLVNKPDWCLHQFRVDFKPNIDLTSERKSLLRVQQKNIGCQYIFDGTVMYSSSRVGNLMKIGDVKYFSERADGSGQVTIVVKLVGELLVGDAHYLQFFNILARKCFVMLGLKLINRDFFDPVAKRNVPEYALEIWPGYKTTIRQHENQVLMCSEIIHKVLRTDTVWDLLCSIVQNNPRDYRAEFTRVVMGTIVLTGYNNKTYTITDVDWDQGPDTTFDKNGVQVSYMNYYRERYNVQIRNVKNQPLLVSKNRGRDRRAAELTGAGAGGDPNIVLLIPELCQTTGLTDEMRSNFHLMKAMSSHTRIGPADRIDRLLVMNRRLNGEKRVQQEFQEWNLKLNDRLVEIPGRVLPPEGIVLGNNMTVPSGDEADWTKSLRSNPMFVMPQGGLSRWAIIVPSRSIHDGRSFVDTLKQAARGMKFMMSDPIWLEMPDDKTQTYVNYLDQCITRDAPQLIFVVLTNNRADRYSAIKKKSLVDRAVPTQVLLAKNMTKKGVMSIATKVAIQINCKIGGAPWSVQMPLGGLMVIGFDVCHDSKQKGKSFGAMVASLNKPMSRYFSAVSHHGTGEELSNDLALNIIKALESYRKYNKTFPSHILIYRDGVGDGQIPYVFEHEVVRINRAISEVIGQAPKLSFVIVSKRINTRLFANKMNPRPGTVVDDVITLPERYDFFIVSQFVNQGTVSPTSYNVIHDTMGLDADKLQRLTYKMTHMYYNWSGTVRVPAPVQYAHKLAFLVSQNLHRPPNPSLEELLYFL
ncbi:piwi-like protein Siwi isoform X2 [Macrosteles quadrilineatus]|uniref:piwi-like protein Siwi isoform X2 n=1 Tax=Macrosteles quadrilineatus TaxID=74068 RepID=UPI0023E1AF28|nr:piwi-like protein Siwi isoform X2 [Macrosteles quadrilineatus]